MRKRKKSRYVTHSPDRRKQTVVYNDKLINYINKLSQKPTIYMILVTTN